MISAVDIGKLIVNPELISNYKASEIKEARDKYPYSSSLHILYLKSISVSSDLDFEDELPFAAAHVLDRERLFHIIQSNSEIKSETISVIEKANESIQEISQDKLETKASLDIIENQTVEPSIKVVDVNPIQAKEELIVEEKITETKESLLTDVAPDLVEIVYEISLDEEENINNELQENVIIEEQKTNDNTIKDSIEIVIEDEIIDEPIDTSKLSFVEWLKYKQGKLSNVKFESETNTEINLEDTIVQQVEQNEPIKKAGMSRKDIDALLNKFIAEEPSISKPQSNFFNPVKNAKQSLEESEDLVTETLAKIYVLQKNYVKAIKAYEQLSLVYPEKKTFFATQIKKIKEQQK